MRVKRRPFQLTIPRDKTRSEGVHLSPILRDLALRTGVLEAKWDEPIEEGCIELVTLGMAWEEFLANHIHLNIQWHAGELVLGDIAMSPDGVSVEGEDQDDIILSADGVSIADPDDIRDDFGIEEGSWTLHEAKLTMKSSRGFEEALRTGARKCLLYLWQIRCYRHALNILYPEHKSYLSCLHALFLRGNYGHMGDPESLPSYQIFDIFHEEEELVETWDMVMSHAETIRSRE